MSRLAPLSAAVAAATLLAVAAGGGPAAAKPIDRGTVHEELDLVLTDFCGVDGLDVDFHGTSTSSTPSGPGAATSCRTSRQLVTGTRTFTNPDNDRVVTERFTAIEKDLRVTDNGDGTFTILVLATGNSTYLGADGKAIARNPGQAAARSSSTTTAPRRTRPTTQCPGGPRAHAEGSPRVAPTASALPAVAELDRRSRAAVMVRLRDHRDQPPATTSPPIHTRSTRAAPISSGASKGSRSSRTRSATAPGRTIPASSRWYTHAEPEVYAARATSRDSA